MTNYAEVVNSFLKAHLREHGKATARYSPQLLAAMEYSLYNGGKRFRPSLCMHTAETLGVAYEMVLPYAAALEMVHTYSLIHDDLPCMDNDNERRGQPTNHILFGEAVALLAGDALLTEAFSLIASSYFHQSEKGIRLVSALARAAGSSGMVGGQAMDMGFGVDRNSIESVVLAHKGKTGALIAAAVEGAGILAGLATEQTEALRIFGENLGLAFQIKDDLLDNETAPNTILHHYGDKQAQEYLQRLRLLAQEQLKTLPKGCETLMDFYSYNQERLQ